MTHKCAVFFLTVRGSTSWANEARFCHGLCYNSESSQLQHFLQIIIKLFAILLTVVENKAFKAISP